MLDTSSLSSVKIAFFTHYSSLYGANRSLLNLIDGLKAYPVTPYVLAPVEGALTEALKQRGVEFCVIKTAWWVAKGCGKQDTSGKRIEISWRRKQALRRLKCNIRALSSVIKKLAEWEVDIVYTNSAVLPIGALVASISRRPHIWHLREFIDLDFNLEFDWGKATTMYLINQADHKIAISNSIRDHFFDGKHAERFSTIYNGIANQGKFDELLNTPNSRDIIDRPYTFAIVGKIQPAKGQDTAIKALSLLAGKYEKTRLLIVGEGNIGELEEMSRELGLSHRVDFWGHVSDPYEAYLSADAVLMCSRNEGMGRVTVEAMSSGLPVIGYDNAGTAEIIQNELTGLTYKGSHLELASAMKRIVDNPSWGEELGLNAWKAAREQFCTEVYTQRVYEVITSVGRQGKAHKVS